jgi:EAL domain-containing protein (putative c-di-GMP-specific phosphodiesterase class I)/GGDEF domain-containing protein
MLHKNGTYRWVSCRCVVVREDDGKAIRLVGSHSDVTGEHAADPETGLPNRLLFLDRLTRSIDRATRDSKFVYAVLLIDIRHPSPEGRATSPTMLPLLTAAARRLETLLRREEHSSAVGDGYVLARLSADHFALLLDGLPRPAEARNAAERVLADLLVPFEVQGRQVFLQPNVGVAVSATGYARTEDVLRDADAALYRARSFGGGRCEVFDTAILESADARLQLEVDLETALERQQFLLFFQPIVSLESSRMVGLEALVRWQHPTRGMISPLEFIPMAERTGFIVGLGAWVMREACRQLKAWQSSVPAAKDLWVSVNISSPQIRQRGFVDEVDDALRTAALEPHCLVLELTESVAIEAPEAVRTALMQLRGIGVRIGLDDFGAGHSSLAYLHQFPADFLKLDQSFVRGLEVRRDKSDILGTVARLGADLGLHVIAEGIESEEALAVVRSSACHSAQGFLFSRPVPADEAADLVKGGLTALFPASGDTAQGAPERSVAPWKASWSWGAARSLGSTTAYGAVAIILVVIAAPLIWRYAPSAESASKEASLPAKSHVVEIARPAAAPSVPTPSPASPPIQSRLAVKRSEPVAGPREPAIRIMSFPVVHQHAFGSCRGTLVANPSGLSFLPEKTKDAFSFSHTQYVVSSAGDILTIKSTDKTYRFEVADTQDKVHRAAAVNGIVSGIASFR